MKNKITKVLITAQNTKVMSKLEQFVYRTLPKPIQVSKVMRIKPAKDIITQRKTDIFIFGTKMADGDSESLIALVNELYPEHPIIVHFEDEDIEHQWRLYDEYDNIKCVTRSKLLAEFKKPLLHAYDKINKIARHRVDFPGVKSISYEKVDDIYHITPAGGGRLLFMIYDWKAKKFRVESRKTNMEAFMNKYNTNGDFIRIHKSSIVNKNMIKRLDRNGRYVVLLIKDKKGEEIQINIGEAYYTGVSAQLEGLD